MSAASAFYRRLPLSVKATLPVLALLLSLWHCRPDPRSSWKEMDLLPYDIPLTILAPDSASVNARELGPYRDVTVRAGRHYAVQILSGRSTAADLAALKTEQKEVIRSNDYFERWVREDPDGFIYELRIDSLASYGFVRVGWDREKEYILRSGLANTFTLEEAERMYEAVKPKK